MQFHISDILAVLTDNTVSLPDHPPIGEDGVRLPNRESTMRGIIQLIEYVTAKQVPREINPASGKEEFGMRGILELHSEAKPILQRQFPELAAISAPTFDEKAGDIEKQIRDWLKPIEGKHGDYLGVVAGSSRHANRIFPSRRSGGIDPNMN